MAQLSDEQLQAVYTWVDEVPLSRPKRNISRDFSDGVLLAEIVAYFHPHLVELHNYSAANSISQKLYNWSTLNQKVLKKLGMTVSKSDVEAVVNCKPHVVERVLLRLQDKLSKFRLRQHNSGGVAPAAHRDKQHHGGAGMHQAPYSYQPAVYDGAGGGAPYQRPTARRRAPRNAAVVSGRPQVVRGVVGAPLEHDGDAENKGAGDLLAEKERVIQELRETVEILELKIKKLEQLVRLKDSKIANLQQKFREV